MPGSFQLQSGFAPVIRGSAPGRLWSFCPRPGLCALAPASLGKNPMGAHYGNPMEMEDNVEGFCVFGNRCWGTSTGLKNLMRLPGNVALCDLYGTAQETKWIHWEFLSNTNTWVHCAYVDCNQITELLVSLHVHCHYSWAKSLFR